MTKNDTKALTALMLGAILGACDALPPPTLQPDFETENRHLNAEQAPEPASDIPEIVRDLPVVSAPQAEPPLEVYSVVVQNVPVRELLFAMARDAGINVDVHPGISGMVSINAIDQTLPQILNRIARQVAIRWNFEESDYLVVQPDAPLLRSYSIDYVNVARNAQSAVSVSSAVSSGVGDGGGGNDTNNSTTVLNQASNNQFWTTLEANLATILGDDSASGVSGNIVVNPETGLVTVRATEREHE